MKMFGLVLLPQFFHLTPEKLEAQRSDIGLAPKSLTFLVARLGQTVRMSAWP